MRGAAKDRAGAVIHQDEVGDIDGQFMRGVKGMAHADAGVKAQLFGRLDRFFGGAALATLGAEGGHVGVLPLQQSWPAGDRARCRQRTRPAACRGGLCKPRSGHGRRARRSVEKANCSPRDLPIQFACISLTLAGQLSSRPARPAVLRNVGDLEEPLRQLAPFDQAPERQPRPSSTCSLASTVISTGSQFTTAFLR